MIRFRFCWHAWELKGRPFLTCPFSLKTCRKCGKNRIVE